MVESLKIFQWPWASQKVVLAEPDSKGTVTGIISEKDNVAGVNSEDRKGHKKKKEKRQKGKKEKTKKEKHGRNDRE